MTKNVDIRTKAKASCVYLWQIAERMSIPDSSLSRILRKELPENEKQEILALIDEIAAGGGR